MKKQTTEGLVVPKTYDDLQHQYGTYIQKLLNRYNKVERNFDDLHSYIWVKILEARLLERFDTHVRGQIPKVVTAIQATEILGISWKQWTTASRLHHVNGKVELGMPTPINEPEFRLRGTPHWEARGALIAFFDVLQLTLERDIGRSWRLPFQFMGRHVKDGEIVGGPRPEGFLKIPEVKVTPSQFRNYLTRSVLNHYANFCRTLDRKHKERPHMPRAGEEPQTSWEGSLEDERALNPEMIAALEEAKDIIRDHLEDETDAASLKEVVFSKLEDGATLLHALRDSTLDPRVRKMLMRTIAG